MNLIQRIRALLAPQKPIPAAGGMAQPYQSPGQIHDGLFYQPPIPMPAHIREDAEAQAAFMEALADEFRTQTGTPYPRGGPFKLPPIVDPLTEWAYDVRRYVLEQCHLYWERNPIAKTAVFYNRAFTVQKGAQITYQNQEVKKVCEDFIDHPENDLRQQEKDTVDALFIDGEVFLRFFVGDGMDGAPGETIVVPLPPWGIAGIKHDIGFTKRIESYHFQLQEDNGDDWQRETEYVNEYIPASDIHHIAINRLAYERRGRPDMFVMLPWLRAYHEWLENRARQNFWRGAILYWVKLTQATASQVMAKLNAYKRPPAPGSLVVSNDKEEWNQFSPNVGASDAGEDGHAIRTMAAVGARMPEAWLSSGSDTNLATIKGQNVPAIRSFADYQDIMREKFWKPLMRRRIQNAIDAGLLPEEVQVQDADGDPIPDAKPVKAIEAFEITYSELGGDEPKDTIAAITLAMQGDLISKATGRGLLPWSIDPRKEEKQLAAEHEAAMQQIKDDQDAGLMPQPDMMRQPNGVNGDNQNGRQQSNNSTRNEDRDESEE